MRVPIAIVRAQGLVFSYPGLDLFGGLSFSFGPGLSLVLGGDGRGKSTLLGLMAGVLEPRSGTVRRDAETVFWENTADPEHDAVTAAAWLDSRRSRFPSWSEACSRELIDAFGLPTHLAKPMHMLSTGSRRKVGLVAAAASRAQLTLLDMPFAALDGPSSRVLLQLLVQAAGTADRAWVVADGARPAGLAGVKLSGLVELGD